MAFYMVCAFRTGSVSDLIHNRLIYGSDNRTIATPVGYL